VFLFCVVKEPAPSYNDCRKEVIVMVYNDEISRDFVVALIHSGQIKNADDAVKTFQNILRLLSPEVADTQSVSNTANTEYDPFKSL
jgi:hypothetical protein